MELWVRATDFATITMKQDAANEGHRPLTERSPTASQGASMKQRTLRRTGITGNDVSLDDKQQTGL
jgi:hypothetical protein